MTWNCASHDEIHKSEGKKRLTFVIIIVQSELTCPKFAMTCPTFFAGACMRFGANTIERFAGFMWFSLSKSVTLRIRDESRPQLLQASMYFSRCSMSRRRR